MEKLTSWVVTASGDLPVLDVARTLRAHGFQVAQVLDAIGVITGRCSAATARTLRTLEGVSDVAPDAGVDIGPPDQPMTW